jgi:hypothetical protein
MLNYQLDTREAQGTAADYRDDGFLRSVAGQTDRGTAALTARALSLF